MSLTVDHAPRTVEPPAVLRDAMAGRPGTLDRWNRLAPSTQKAHALSIESAKTDETRSRRVAKVLDGLTEGLAEG